MEIRALQRGEIARIWEIDRREIVEKVYRLDGGTLRLGRQYFDVQGWPPGEPERYAPLFLDCHDRGGLVLAAFEGDALVGAAILDSAFIGRERATLQLKFLHVSRDWRRQGLATRLFDRVAAEAGSRGAMRLYVSATPSQNTVDFYRRRGCVLASEVDADLFALEPEDIHLECPIARTPGA